MRVLIIEDEVLAAERLADMVMKLLPQTEIMAKLDSISAAVRWFGENPSPDLAFFDIQLADGISFEIFEKTRVDCPVIFTTAYDEYALKAFKVNSIDYLLKPIDDNELKRAIDKYHFLHANTGEPQNITQNIDNVIRLLTKQYKSRFVVKVGEHIRSVPTDEILCFYSMAKASYFLTEDNRNYVMDHSLEQIANLVDPDRFFRVSRSYIVAIDAITDIISYSNSRLKLKLKHPTEDDIIVAREKVREFKLWLEK